jgi:hypothetical protein
MRTPSTVNARKSRDAIRVAHPAYFKERCDVLLIQFVGRIQA